MKQETPTVMLFWVKAEIDHALKGVRDRIAQFREAGEDLALLKTCPAQLHQVAGALRIFDLMGVLRFTEAIEAGFVQIISAGKPAPQAVELLDRSIAALGEFVDGLSKGALNAPLRLYALYRELAALDGKERVSRRDLFYPDLKISAPRHAIARILPSAALPEFVRTQRARYQRGLLIWLREPSKREGLQEMREALDALDQVAPQLSEPRSLWWAAVGMIDGLMHSPRPDWAAMAKALCTKVEFQLRSLASGKPLDPQVLRDILYALVGCKPATARMRDVRKRFNLDSLLPAPDEDSGLNAVWQEAALGEVRARLDTIKETWVQYVSSKPDQLARFRELVAALKTKASELDSQPLVRLLDVVGVVSARLPDPYPREGQLMVMEMASAFLLAESIVEQFDEPPADLDQQIVIMNGWLLDAAKNKSVCEPPQGLRADLIQKYNEAHLRAQVAREILANLQHSEEVIDAFARDPATLDTLTRLAPTFKQIHGALLMLGCRRASEVLSECETMINAALAPDQEDPLENIHWIAEGLSTLGVFLEPCLRGRAAVDEPLERFFTRFKQRDALSQPSREEPAEAEAPTSEAAAESATVAVSPVAAEPTTAQAPAPADSASAPAQSAPEAMSATAPAADTEMLEIFLEEAEEVLSNIVASHAECTSRSDNREALTVIRRGFHTLKGSGRMVGLTDLGEVAWEIEQVMNRWLEHDEAATLDLLDLIAAAAAAFSGWIGELKSGGSPRVEAGSIVAAAQALRGVAVKPATPRDPVALPPDPVSTPPRLAAEVAAPPAPALADAASAAAAEADPTLPHIVDVPTLDARAFGLEYDARPAQPSAEESAPATNNVGEAPATSLPDESADAAVVASPVTDPAAEPIAFEADTGTKITGVPQATPGAAETAPAEASDETFAGQHASNERAGSLESLDFSADAPEQETAPSAAAPAAPIEAEKEVIVGTARLSPGFYEIYLKEAQQHLGTLETEGASGSAAPSDDFLRAAHTLASISRTAGIDAIAQVAAALEAWAQHAQNTGTPLSAPPVGAAISRLQEMVACVARREAPAVAESEAAALRELCQQRVAPPLLHTWFRREQTSGPGDAELIARAAELPQQREQRAIRDDLDQQLLPIFLEEALELLPQIGSDLRAWRADPNDANIPLSLKRALHTLKGSARMAGAMRLGELTHLMESAVEAAAESGLSSGVLDRLEAQMDRLVHDVERLQQTGGAAASEAAPVDGDSGTPEPQADPALPAQAAAPLAMPASMLRINADALDRMANGSGEISIARTRVEAELRSLRQGVIELTESIMRLRAELREMEIQADSQMQSRMSVLEQERADFDPLEFDRYTRLQELTRMMAEGLHDVATVQQNLLRDLDGADVALLHQARLSRELQQELMQVRTVPFANLSERLHRIVRQTAREVGKRANLEITGSRIEIDRSVLERIGAPLEHLLRNAVGHGLETPERRTRLGKPETGEIGVALRQEGDEVVIEVTDDGAGLDLEKLRRKALEKGLIPSESTPDETQLTQLIFLPGLSTADSVTELSGRGVGMDVVRSEITSIGGRIETRTRQGNGTKFTIYLPLTLAVTQAVLVRGGPHLFAVPSAMIEQVLRVKNEELSTLEAAGRAEFRGNDYPLCRLGTLLGGQSSGDEPRTYHSVLLLKSGTHRIALHVDELSRNQEIVIKNIGPQLSRVSWVTGATVLADGRIVLIMNPVELAAATRPAQAAVPAEAVAPVAPAAVPQALVVMVVDDSLTVRKVTGRLLEREGYRVLTAKDGVDALEQVGTTVPDVMLVDIEMPRMDGFDLARNIRGNPATAAVPIIMISSRSAEKHRNHALELGVNAFIGKPYQEAELLAQIVAFTGRRGEVVYH